MDSFLSFFTANWSEITVGILAGLRVLEVIVKLTPTDVDNKVFIAIDGLAGKLLGRR
jgi:hypothetical protein